MYLRNVESGRLEQFSIKENKQGSDDDESKAESGKSKVMKPETRKS